MKNMRIPALLLAAVLATAAVVGCTEPRDDSSVAMGRYVEQTWAFPGEDTELATSLHRTAYGKPAMLTAAEEGSFRYYIAEDGDNWHAQSLPWVDALSDMAMSVINVSFNSRGQGIVAYYGVGSEDGETRYRIGLIHPDGTITDTPIGQEDPWSAASVPALVDTAADDPTAADTDRQTDPAAEDDDLTRDDSLADGNDTVGEDSADNEDDDSAVTESDDSYASQMYIRSAMMGEDGLVYLESTSLGCFDPATGELLQTYLKWSSAYTVAGDEMVQLITPSRAAESGHIIDTYSLFFIDTKSGELVRILPAESLSLGGGVNLTAEQDGTLYVTDATGLYRIASGGETWEKLLDGALSSLSMPSLHASDLVPHGDNEFVVMFGGDAKQLINYVYSPDTPTLPDTELTVYSMMSNRTLSQAVGVFRQQYPNTLVSIRTSQDDDSGNGDDARKALNTEILAGKGPDLFILDELPLESYLEKGVLADISDVVDPMIDSGELLPAPAQTYRRGDAIYAVPARITVPTMWGEQEALAAGDSLDTLVAYAEEHPDIRLFGDMTPQHILYRMTVSEWDNLVDAQGGVNVDGVEKLLDGVTRLSQTVTDAHVYQYFSTAAENAKEQWGNHDGQWPEDYFALTNRRAELMPIALRSFSNVVIPNGVMYIHGGGIVYDVSGDGSFSSFLPDEMVDKVFRSFPQGGGFSPVSVIGVNAASEQPELARAFVKAMLSEETQTTDFEDGFPIHRAAIASGAARQEDWWFGDSYNAPDDTERRELNIEVGWPSTAMLQSVAAMLEKLEYPIGQNYSLAMRYGMQELLCDELERVVSGEATAREAAQSVANRLHIPVEE